MISGFKGLTFHCSSSSIGSGILSLSGSFHSVFSNSAFPVMASWLLSDCERGSSSPGRSVPWCSRNHS